MKHYVGWWLQRDSNPRFGLEKAVTWSAAAMTYERVATDGCHRRLRVEGSDVKCPSVVPRDASTSKAYRPDWTVEGRAIPSVGVGDGDRFAHVFGMTPAETSRSTACAAL